MSTFERPGESSKDRFLEILSRHPELQELYFIEWSRQHDDDMARTTDGLFRIPFDRDYRLIPAEADNWDQEAIEAFYMGVEAGIGVVRARYEDHAEWRRSSAKAAR